MYMKKYIFSAILFSAAVATSLTSCEDMLKPESNLVTYEENHTLSSANDSLYSVMGVIHLMQKVADRTNLLGEIRSDMVSLTDAATTDLKDLANFDVKEGNVYNQPQDYYAIINNCNYFINHADPNYKKRGQSVFQRELAVMHTFRAWAYLQLTLNYGDVPFYTDFISTEEQAEAILQQPHLDMKSICDKLIEDLTPWINVPALSYKGLSDSRWYFIPVRLMLGELCLWSERYEEAAQWYHDFLTDTSKPRPSYSFNGAVYWNTNTRPAYTVYTRGYISGLLDGDEVITYIPFENTPFDGIVSELPTIYTSDQDLNQYYYQAEPSNAAISLSAKQPYYYVYIDEITHMPDTVSMNDTLFINSALYGDLRLYASYNYGTVSSNFSSKYNDHFVDITKIEKSILTIYRLQTVYLHYAEALNLAGYPSSAFAILKYGLCQENIERGYVDEREVALAGNLISFSETSFTPVNSTAIHDRGCGDSYANPEYVLPEPTTELGTYADTAAYWQPFVEEKILDEEMLEGCFEGLRYYDLLRMALRHNDPSILANAISQRDVLQGIPYKEVEGEKNVELYNKLMDKKNWFLPLK